jgi:hypothetical protein
MRNTDAATKCDAPAREHSLLCSRYVPAPILKHDASTADSDPNLSYDGMYLYILHHIWLY